MNLLAYTAGYVETVNPRQSLTYQSSSGYVTDASFKQVPGYATPTAFTGSIAGNVLTVTEISLGQFGQEQTIAGLDVLAATFIQAQLSGTAGGIGTYQVNNAQEVGSEAMTSSLVVQGQVQPMQYKDLLQTEGLNLNGTRRKVYLYGASNGVVRTSLKGGDLLTDQINNVWKVALLVEQWAATWCSVVVTLQNGA
jgi:hypothetical protein